MRHQSDSESLNTVVPTTAMMQPKKNRRYDLSTYSTLFFNIGLVISLALVNFAFEWNSPEQKSKVNLLFSNDAHLELMAEIPQTKQPPPVAPRLQQPQVMEVPDEEEVEVEIDVNLDIELLEEDVIEETVFKEEPEEEIANELFIAVEEMPMFPGGNLRFSQFVMQNLDYPMKARIKGVEGKVIVEFIVNENGEISQIAINKGIGYGCDEAAKNLIQSSPNWIPGKQAGKNVRVKMAVALMFDLGL